MPTLALPARWSVSWVEIGAAAAALAGAVLAALVAHAALFAVLRRVTGRSASSFDDILVGALRRPLRWAMVAFALSVVASSEALVGAGWNPVARFVMPAILGWVVFAVIGGVQHALMIQAEGGGETVGQRGRLTRVAILSRTAKVAVVIIAISLAMLNIPGVRDVGTTLLASAGLAALAVGAAAQPALKSLIAGLQMALTQPLRLGDLVKIDGQSGRVEDIKMSYVTVRTWDERVLVVPTQRFLENTFENWSRVSEALTGAVMLYLEPHSAIEPIRAEFERFVAAHPLWDGRNRAMLMTDARPGSVELRLAVSAATIANLFTFRCEVREHMQAWLTENMPDALLRVPPAGEAVVAP